MNDNYAIYFAFLCGEFVGAASSVYEELLAKKLRQLNSEELLDLLSVWTKEFLNSNEMFLDSCNFLRKKLNELVEKSDLEKLCNSGWVRSDYTDRIFYVDSDCEPQSVAFLYDKEGDEVVTLIVQRAIFQSEDFDAYDSLPEDVLLKGEEELGSDASAEFITDEDCFLVWFREEE